MISFKNSFKIKITCDNGNRETVVPSVKHIADTSYPNKNSSITITHS